MAMVSRNQRMKSYIGTFICVLAVAICSASCLASLKPDPLPDLKAFHQGMIKQVDFEGVSPRNFDVASNYSWFALVDLGPVRATVDMRTGKPIGSMPGHVRVSSAFALSSDGKTLFSVQSGRGMRTISVDTFDLTDSGARTSANIRVEEFMPQWAGLADSNQLITADVRTGNAKLVAIDYRNGKLAWASEKIEGLRVHRIRISPGGKQVATAEMVKDKNTLVIRDTYNGKELGQFATELDKDWQADGLVYSVDGERLAAIFRKDDEGQLLIWSLKSGKLKKQVEFSLTHPNGKRISSLSGNHWPVEFTPDGTLVLVHGKVLIDELNDWSVAYLAENFAAQLPPRVCLHADRLSVWQVKGGVLSMDHLALPGKEKLAYHKQPEPEQQAPANEPNGEDPKVATADDPTDQQGKTGDSSNKPDNVTDVNQVTQVEVDEIASDEPSNKEFRKLDWTKPELVEWNYEPAQVKRHPQFMSRFVEVPRPTGGENILLADDLQGKAIIYNGQRGRPGNSSDYGKTKSEAYLVTLTPTQGKSYSKLETLNDHYPLAISQTGKYVFCTRTNKEREIYFSLWNAGEGKLINEWQWTQEMAKQAEVNRLGYDSVQAQFVADNYVLIQHERGRYAHLFEASTGKVIYTAKAGYDNLHILPGGRMAIDPRTLSIIDLLEGKTVSNLEYPSGLSSAAEGIVGVDGKTFVSRGYRRVNNLNEDWLFTWSLETGRLLHSARLHQNFKSKPTYSDGTFTIYHSYLYSNETGRPIWRYHQSAYDRIMFQTQGLLHAANSRPGAIMLKPVRISFAQIKEAIRGKDLAMKEILKPGDTVYYNLSLSSYGRDINELKKYLQRTVEQKGFKWQSDSPRLQVSVSSSSPKVLGTEKYRVYGMGVQNREISIQKKEVTIQVKVTLDGKILKEYKSTARSSMGSTLNNQSNPQAQADTSMWSGVEGAVKSAMTFGTLYEDAEDLVFGESKTLFE